MAWAPRFIFKIFTKSLKYFHMIEIHYDHASSISFVSIKKKEFFQKLIREILISGYISYLIHFISFLFFFMWMDTYESWCFFFFEWKTLNYWFYFRYQNYQMWFHALKGCERGCNWCGYTTFSCIISSTNLK
jgi:hypothetical protein